MLRRVVKAIFPQRAINWVSDKLHAARLAGLPAQALNTVNLAPGADLRALFSSRFDNWEKDRAALSAIYGDEERPGAVNPGDRKALYYLVRGLKPTRVLEIGTHVGASTLHLAMALRANQAGTVTTVDIIDVNRDPAASWQRVGLSRPPIDLAAQLGCADHIQFVVSNALDFMSRGGTFDFIFLDGDHSAMAVYREVAMSTHLLAPGGRILLHDYYPDGKPLGEDCAIYGPYRGMSRVMRESQQITVQPLGDLPWPTRKGSRLTSLAFVVRR